MAKTQWLDKTRIYKDFSPFSQSKPAIPFTSVNINEEVQYQDPPAGAQFRYTLLTQSPMIVNYKDFWRKFEFELLPHVEALLRCLNYEDTDTVLIIQNVLVVWRVFI